MAVHEEWVTAEKSEGSVGEIKDWYSSLDEALENAKDGDLIALEYFDEEKGRCWYTNVLEVLDK